MIFAACFENPLFDRVFLIKSRRPSSVCVSAGAVLGCEGDSGGCLDEAARLAELLKNVRGVDTNSGKTTPVQLTKVRPCRVESWLVLEIANEKEERHNNSYLPS